MPQKPDRLHASVVAVGVVADGRREVLGFDVGDTENEGFWIAFLRSLKVRGSDGVKLVMSVAHSGLKKAIGTVFLGSHRPSREGSSRQRCDAQNRETPPLTGTQPSDKRVVGYFRETRSISLINGFVG